MQAILLILSAILIVIGPITYIVSIARGTSKPHRMTRFILFFVLSLNFFSILAAHGNFGADLFAGITFIQAVIIFFMSLWWGMGGSSIVDWICLIVAIIGIICWKITGNPIFGVWFSILADFSAYLPAFIKTWKQPKTESPWYYLLSGLAALLSLVAYRIETASIFQIYIAFSCIVMVFFIYRKDIFRLNKSRIKS